MSSTDAEAPPTEQDYSKRLRDLTDRKEQLERRATKLQLIHEQATKDLATIEDEMKVLGTSPEKIDEDLAAAEKDVKQVLEEYEKHLDTFDQELTKAEESLDTDA